MEKENLVSTARAATLEELRQNLIPNFVQPVPSAETIRGWFDAAGIPRFKTNPFAKRGGGPVYYSVPAVEKFFRARMVPVFRTRQQVRPMC